MEDIDPFGFEDTEPAGQPAKAAPASPSTPPALDPTELIDEQMAQLMADPNKSKPKTTPADPATPQPKILGKYNSYKDLEKAYKELQREHTRISQEFKTYKPVIEAMETDSGFVEHMKQYVNGSEQDRTKQSLGLSEGFQFNPNDLADPDSESSRYFSYLVQQQAARQTQEELNRHKNQEGLMKQVNDMQERYGLDQSEIAELLQKGKGMSLTLEDIYLLTNRDEIFKQAEAVGARKVIEARGGRSGLPAVAATGGAAPSKGNANQGFNFINNLLAAAGEDDPFGF